jgi:hypothetical protein
MKWLLNRGFIGLCMNERGAGMKKKREAIGFV